MTMMFRTVKDSVVSILGAAAAGRYRVSGYQELDLAADEIVGADRLVQAFYKRGDFPKSASGRGPFAHDVRMHLKLTVSQPAFADLTVLDDPAATPVQLAAALAALEPAGEKAEDAMNEFIDIIYTTLMAGDNLDLGNLYKVANRWIPDVEKSDTIHRGEFAVVGAIMPLEFRVQEEVPTTAKADLDFVSNDLSIQDDGAPKAGTEEDF